MTRKEIKKCIRELRAEMRENGVKKTSCFNGGLTPEERRYNTKMFELETMLLKTP